MNINQTIQELINSIRIEEADLFTKSQKWKIENGGDLQKWQKDILSKFLHKKSLIETLTETFQELREKHHFQESESKFKYVLGFTKLHIVEHFVKMHLNDLFNFALAIETKIPPDQETLNGVYDFHGHLQNVLIMNACKDFEQTTKETLAEHENQ